MSPTHFFVLALTVSGTYFLNVTLKTYVKVMSAIFAMTPFDGKWQVFVYRLHNFALAVTISEKKVKFSTFKKQVEVTLYNFRKDAIRWQMSKSTKDSHSFFRQLLLFHKYRNLKCIISKNQIKVTKYDFLLKSTNVSRTFLRQLLPFQRYTNFNSSTLKKQIKAHSTQHIAQFWQ